jgi:hypothetical protein
MTSNERKTQTLGLPLGTASNRLRKSILFKLIKKCGEDLCYRCNKQIESVEQLSIDHKEDWLYSDKPIQLFYDLENIAFSHLKCNVELSGARKKKGVKHPSSRSYNEGCRCKTCKSFEAKRRAIYRSK